MLPSYWRRNGFGHSVPQAPMVIESMLGHPAATTNSAAGQAAGAGETVAPAMDVTETDEAYEVMVDLPGMDPAAVELSWLDGTLTLNAERPVPATAEGRRMWRRERKYGRFARTIEFGVPVQESEIAATYIDGVLRLYVPKTPAARPRRIDITTG